MTPQEIINGLKDKNIKLSQKNDEYSVLQEKFASAKRDYQIALASQIIRLKIDKHPATLIPKLAQGDRTVSDLEYKMNVAEGVMRACLESIKDLREAIGTYRSLLTWLRAELTGQD